jgi:hypothetical protein
MNIRPTFQHEATSKHQHPQVYNKNPAQDQFEQNMKTLNDNPKEYIHPEKLQKKIEGQQEPKEQKELREGEQAQ